MINRHHSTRTIYHNEHLGIRLKYRVKYGVGRVYLYIGIERNHLLDFFSTLETYNILKPTNHVVG